MRSSERIFPANHALPWLPPRHVSVAIQGASYSNSFNCCAAIFGDRGSSVSYNTLAECFAALASGDVDFACIPLANTIAQYVPDAMKYLRDNTIERNISIVHESIRQINHCLLGFEGTRLEDIEWVRSHPVALNQCTQWLDQKSLKRQQWYDTAGAAADIAKEQDPTLAAIAPREAAEPNGLVVLAENIQNINPNQTRFVVLSRESFTPQENERNYRTALFVRLKQQGHFSAHGCMSQLILTMEKAGRMVGESLTFIGPHFTYPTCYIEVQGPHDHQLVKILRGSKDYIADYHFAGCFPHADRNGQRPPRPQPSTPA